MCKYLLPPATTSEYGKVGISHTPRCVNAWTLPPTIGTSCASYDPQPGPGSAQEACLAPLCQLAYTTGKRGVIYASIEMLLSRGVYQEERSSRQHLLCETCFSGWNGRGLRTHLCVFSDTCSQGGYVLLHFPIAGKTSICTEERQKIGRRQ